jgi:hypothetical protein
MQQIKVDYLVKKESTILQNEHPYLPITSTVVEIGVGYVDLVRENNKGEQVQNWLNLQTKLMNDKRTEQEKKLFRYAVRSIDQQSELALEEE